MFLPELSTNHPPNERHAIKSSIRQRSFGVISPERLCLCHVVERKWLLLAEVVALCEDCDKVVLKGIDT